MPAFVMAGGGTGGHVIPALAVANELRARGHHVYFVGTQRGIEARLVPAAGFPIEWIQIGGLNRVGFRKALSSTLDLPRSVWDAMRVLSRIRPAAVFSMGGYVAGPVLLAAVMKRVPIVAMEPNAIPGFTHRHLSRYIARALVSFPETACWFRPGKTELTGMPVRPEFFNVPPRKQTPEFTILITGGSQGSRTLNRAAQESWSLWKQMMDRPVRLLHQTGRSMFAELAPLFAQAGVAGELHEFLNDMPSAYEAADIVVSRAGMGAVSELAAAGKPSILVPFPGAADQHQHKNAEMMQKAGASILVEDSEMTGRRLVEEVARLANDPVAMERMSVAARSMAHPDAARTAANILEEFV